MCIYIRGGSRAAATSKMDRFVIIATNFYYHKALHLGCCSSPRSASVYKIILAIIIFFFDFFLLLNFRSNERHSEKQTLNQ